MSVAEQEGLGISEGRVGGARCLSDVGSHPSNVATVSLFAPPRRPVEVPEKTNPVVALVCAAGVEIHPLAPGQGPTLRFTDGADRGVYARDW